MPAVTRGSFLASAHRELSVALGQCQGAVDRDCANLLATAEERAVVFGTEILYVATAHMWSDVS